MVKPYLNKVGGEVESDVSLFSGGLNTYVDKAFLEADQMPYVMNMEIGSAPGIKTRASRITVADFMEGDEWELNVGSIIDMFSYDQYQVFIVAKKSNSVHVYKMYRPYSSGYRVPKFVVEDMGTIPEENCYYFTIARQETKTWVYITGLTFKVKISVEGNPLDTEMHPVSDGKYGICCCHKGRMFLANPESNTITFSALRDFDNFDEKPVYQLLTQAPNDNMPNLNTSYRYLVDDTIGGYDVYEYDAENGWVSPTVISQTDIVLDSNGMSLPDYSVIAGAFKVTNSIGKIISLKSFDDKLMIFCEHSMHTMYGDTPDISMQNQFQLVDLNNNLGAIADRCIAIGGGRLFWLGDNNEIYEYTGSAINMISRPGNTRNTTLSVGGVSGVVEAYDWDKWTQTPVDFGGSHSKFAATSEKLFVNIWNARETFQKVMFVFDIYNRTWWCEDGQFNTICDFSQNENRILIGKNNGDILMSNMKYSHAWNEPQVDRVYNFDTNSIEDADIEYEFHTRVYGADGTDLRKSISKVWLQCDASAEVFLDDMWTSWDRWSYNMVEQSNMLKIGDLKWVYMPPTMDTTYRPEQYEQQVCYVEKMYGQRLNTFQIVIKGKGHSSFYLMKREWRAR